MIMYCLYGDFFGPEVNNTCETMMYTETVVKGFTVLVKLHIMTS